MTKPTQDRSSPHVVPEEDWGAAFEFSAAPDSGPSRDVDPATSRGAAEPFGVLCIDDEPNILSSLRRLLRPTGYRVLTASSGEEGLAIMAREPVDLVVSDMRMPGLDGAQVLARVRECWPDTVRILLTGYADITTTVAAINDGQLHRYISKPWDDDEVLLVVREGLEKKALLREKARLEALTRAQNEELRTLNASLEQKVEARTAELAQAHERLKAAFLNTVKIFSDLVELRGGQMAGHSRRVADLSRRVGQKMDLPPQEAQDLFFAALLHDIGKIGLPDVLLAKPHAQLTPEERAQMMHHPARGEALLMGLDQLRGAAHLIRTHHERFDGQGYPDRLSGIAIPLGARILAAANDYDAARHGMITPHRASAEEALRYIQDGRSKRYDPAVVAAFEDLFERKPAIRSGPFTRVPSDQLESGMVLAKDLVTHDGVLLLAQGFLIDERLIRQIRNFERAEGYGLELYVEGGRT